MTRYAETTSVSSEQSRAEIERTLRRYGAGAFAYGWNSGGATVGFELRDRHVRFELPLPDPKSPEFTRTPAKKLWRTEEAAAEAYEQGARQRWRALALAIKAKLEAVQAGITTVEQEFLAHIVLPDGSTVGQWVSPQIERVYRDNRMPALMPGVTQR